MEYNLSIIIPHFNSPELLEKLLLTIPEKEDIQIIVVDDNSTKELEEYNAVVERYAYRAEFYKNNSGIQSAGACRNLGLDYAKGIWVLFADADDFFLPEMYEKVSKYFKSDEEMVIFCPTSVFIDTGDVADRHLMHEERIMQYLDNPTYENLINVKRMKAPWSKLIRLSVIKDNELRFSEILHSNDMYFSFMVSYFCRKVSVSKDRIYCITRSQGSLTTKITENAFNMYVEETIKCYKFGIEKYNKFELAYFNINGGVLLFQAYKRHLGIKKIISTYIILKKSHIPLMSKQMRNPIYLLRAIMKNSRMVNRENKYYVRN